MAINFLDNLKNPANLSYGRKCAIVKAMLYIINANRKITEAEKKILFDFLVQINADEKLLQDAKQMTNQDMYNNLDQIALLSGMDILAKASQADGDSFGEGYKVLSAIINNSKLVKEKGLGYLYHGNF